MPTEAKINQVADIEDRLRRAVITIGLDYRGLTVGQMRELRLALRTMEPSIEMRVVKNTLTKIAAENAGKPEITNLTKEATALVLGYGEQINPPKALTKFMTDSRLELTIHGGFMDGALLTPNEIADLATIPSRLELMAKVAGGVTNPVGNIAGSLQAIIREVAAIIEAHAKQLNEQEDGSASQDNKENPPKENGELDGGENNNENDGSS